MQPLAEAVRPWLDREPWRVAGIRQESRDTVSLELEPPAGCTFSFLPGQFNMLYAFGVGEVPISVSGDPATVGPVLHTIRDVGAVTHALCTLQPGQQVGVGHDFVDQAEAQRLGGRHPTAGQQHAHRPDMRDSPRQDGDAAVQRQPADLDGNPKPHANVGGVEKLRHDGAGQAGQLALDLFPSLGVAIKYADR